MNIEPIVRAVQKELGVTVDGKAGPLTWQAIHARVCGKKTTEGTTPVSTTPKLPAGTNQAVDERSESVIATLQPEVRPFARGLVLKAASIGITIKLISGLRTFA